MAVKHDMFERNLIAGSGRTTLEDAAPFWELSHVGVVPKGNIAEHCQLCHTALIKYAVIRNTETDVRKRIGFDCYGKLLRYFETNKITSIRLQGLEEHEHEQREYTKRHISASMLAWLRSRQDLPNHARLSVQVIDVLGYPPSLVAAELLVAYYRTNRYFSLDNTDLIAPEIRILLKRYPDRNSLPQLVNFDEMTKVEIILEAWSVKDKLQHERDERDARLEIIAPKDVGQVIEPRHTMLHGHVFEEGVYKYMNVSVILDNDRYDFVATLWREHPFEGRVTDAKSRDLLACKPKLYGMCIERTIPASFRVVRGTDDTICVAEPDLCTWAGRAFTELEHLITLEVVKLNKARERREAKYGVEYVNTCKVALKDRLREERWMVVPWTGKLCGNHWDECLSLLKKKYGEKRGGEIYDLCIPASRDVPVEYCGIVAGHSEWCMCYLLNRTLSPCLAKV